VATNQGYNCTASRGRKGSRQGALVLCRKVAWEQPRGALPASTAIAPVMDLVKPLLTELQNPWPELLSCLVSTGGTLLKYLVLAEYYDGQFPEANCGGQFPEAN